MHSSRWLLLLLHSTAPLITLTSSPHLPFHPVLPSHPTLAVTAIKSSLVGATGELAARRAEAASTAQRLDALERTDRCMVGAVFAVCELI